MRPSHPYRPSLALLAAAWIASLSTAGCERSPEPQRSSPGTPSGAAKAPAKAPDAAKPPFAPAPATGGKSAIAPAASRPPAGPPLSDAERRGIAARISFIAERDGNREVYLITADGSRETRLTHDPAPDYNGPATADGRAMIVTRVEPAPRADAAPQHAGGGNSAAAQHANGDGNAAVQHKAGDGTAAPQHGDSDPHAALQQLWLYPLLEGGGRGAPRRLAPAASRVRNPSWSPDGRWLAFESSIDGFSDIYRIDRDGRALKRLTANPEGNYEPVVSPRGDALAIASSRDRVAELYLLRPDGGAAQRLTRTTRDEWSPRWSPDGAALVFASDRDGADRLYLLALATGETRRLSRRDLDTATVEEAPTWSADGRRIAYVLRRAGEPSRVIIADLANNTDVELSGGDTAADAGEPAFSPDGRYLALGVTRGPDAQIRLARADGSGAVQVTHGRGPNWHPSWVPDPRGRGATPVRAPKR